MDMIYQLLSVMMTGNFGIAKSNIGFKAFQLMGKK